METFEFRQVHRSLLVLCMVGYLILLLVLLFGVVGKSAAEDYLNGVHSYKGLGIAIAFVALLPVFFLLRFAGRATRVQIDDRAIVIQAGKSPAKTIELSHIQSLILNRPPGGLYLANKQSGGLYTFVPQRNPQIAPQLLAAILKRKPFDLVKETPILRGALIQKEYAGA